MSGANRKDFTGASLSVRGRRGDVDTRGPCEASLDVRSSSDIGKRNVPIGGKNLLILEPVRRSLSAGVRNRLSFTSTDSHHRRRGIRLHSVLISHT